MEKQIHHGNNVRRFRELFDMKQDTLAAKMGSDWNQKKISQLEQKPIIEKGILSDVAKALNIPPEAIERFDEEAAVNFINNTFTDNQFAGYTVNNNPTFNPLDKVVELYERMIKEKDEQIEKLRAATKN